MNPTRSQVIDIMRAMAIVLVVLGHALIFCKHLNGLMEAIYSFHMPLMFSISGYVTAMSWKGDALCKIARSAKRLLIPYAFFALLVIPLVNAGITDDISGSFLKAWRNALVLNRSLWFLPCCFILVCVYALSRQIRLKRILSYAVALLPIAVFYVFFTQIDYFRSTLSYAFSFFVGAWFCEFISSRHSSLDVVLERVRVHSILCWLCTGMFFALAIVFAVFHFPVAMKPIVGLFSLAPAALLARWLTGRSFLSRGLSFVGQSTLVIYCLDFIATPLTIRYLAGLSWAGVISVSLLVALTFLYVPVAVALFCFVRLLWNENMMHGRKPTL